MIFRRFFLLFIAVFFAISSVLSASDGTTDSLIRLVKNDQIKDSFQKYKAYLSIASNSTDVDIILYYSQQAIDLATELKINTAPAIVSKGIGYLNSGKLSMALECFLKAANIYKSGKNSIGLGTAYMYISETYNMQENHNNEILYLKNAISIFKSAGDSINLASGLHNLGYANYSMGQYDSALVLFNYTGEIYKNLGYKAQYAYCIGNKGLVYSKQHKLENAEENLLSAIRLLTEVDDLYAITQYSIEYATVLQNKGNISEALKYASAGYNYSRRNNFIEFERDAAYRLARIFMEKGRYDSACYYQDQYITCSDSIKNYATIQKMADLRTDYEVAKKQSEVDVLEKNRLIQRIVIISLAVILLLAAWLISLYYTSIKRLRRLTAILEERRVLLEKQSLELKELNRIKDKFFSVVSHDLRGPISSIGGISYMIKEGIASNNSALLHETTNYIDQTVFSLTSLLENLLNWAQNQQGQFPYREEKINTKELIEDVVKVFSTVSILKSIKISLALKSDLFISADRNSMMMILRNLLSNALKFTETDGIVSIKTTSTKDGKAEIIIKDNGIGIPEDKLAWLFDFKEDKSTYGTDKEKGIGLGLNLVHEFVKMNKGTIEVKSKLKKGSTFTLYFPVFQV